MKRQTKLTSHQAEEQQLAASLEQAGQTRTHEFASVEELLRHDALHTPVPPKIAQRLQESVHASEPGPNRTPWWRRWFGS